MANELPEALVAKLRLLAKRKTLADRVQEAEDANTDPPTAQDYSGGNFDDAWDSGERDGETHFARELLQEYGHGE